MESMEECFRWYGPADPVTLSNVKQTGATGVVSALHHQYDGSPWRDSDVARYKANIESSGLTWSVVESIPVHNSIKIGGPERGRYIGWYKDSIRAVASAGVKVICYNFMPVVDWTRTDLMYPLVSSGFALRFDAVDFAAYDLFVLKRPKAADDYTKEESSAAEARHRGMGNEDIARLEQNLIAGLPATERKFDRAGFKAALAEYEGLEPEDLRANLVAFLREIVPVAEEAGVRLGIHPDDPPFSLYGLPRIVSTASDLSAVVEAVDSPSNGITFCTGSLGAREDNDLTAMVKAFASRIHFAHLRNVKREADGSFYEADHLGGSSNLPAVIIALMREQDLRKREGRSDWRIPMRPDHGHLLADDIGKERINPGYSLIGRLKGLAELRGVMHGVIAMSSGDIVQEF